MKAGGVIVKQGTIYILYLKRDSIQNKENLNK